MNNIPDFHFLPFKLNIPITGITETLAFIKLLDEVEMYEVVSATNDYILNYPIQKTSLYLYEGVIISAYYNIQTPYSADLLTKEIEANYKIHFSKERLNNKVALIIKNKCSSITVGKVPHSNNVYLHHILSKYSLI